uniref:GPI mannosyltransferase 2 n=1 Tax=Caenorhabditis tropicalis TaxID=1561998 RepID=A0A1I7UXS9_9PELO
MTRHGIRRDNRADAELEIEELEGRMVTYEEAALKEEESGFSFSRFLQFPVPNKIVEMDAIAKNAFSARRFAFFTERNYGNKEDDESRDGSPDNTTESDEDSYDDSGSEGGTEEEKSAHRDWKLWECFWFCLRQLFFSRVWVLIIQFLAAHFAGNRFRTDAFALADDIIEPGKSVLGDIVVRRAFLGLRRWDAQHFLFISDNHYIFEHSLAFFPGYPEVVNICRLAVHEYMTNNVGWTFPSWVVTGIASVLINFFFFHVAGISLFLVVLMATRSVKQGLLAVSIFAYNPASIFFTAAYSESMFFTLTITGMNFMLASIRSMNIFFRTLPALVGTLVFGLSFVVRSNGLLNVMFVAWYWAAVVFWAPAKPVPDCHILIESLSASRNERYRREGQARLRQFERKRKQTRKVFRWTEPGFNRGTLVFSLIVYIPIVLFVFFGPYVYMANSAAEEFCEADANQKSLVASVTKQIRMPPKVVTIVDAYERTTWCRREKLFGLVRHYYSDIQAKYWDVGLFGYWQIKKIPCFLLMLPAAILTMMAIRWAWRAVFEEKRWKSIWVLLIRSDHYLHFALHAFIMLVTAVFFINSEVFTRLIFSSNPLLYIFIAQYIDKLTPGNTVGNRLWQYASSPGILPFFVFRRVWQDGWKGKALYIYFFGYFIFGTLAHAAWLPFT